MRKKKEKNYLISEESAEGQYGKVIDFYGIDEQETDKLFGDPKSDTEEEAKERKNFERSFIFIENRWVEFTRLGIIEAEETGDTLVVRQTLTRPFGDIKVITYKEVNNEAKIEQGKASDKDKQGQICYFLGYLSGLGYDTMTKLKGRDLKAAETIATLFFHV